MLISKKITRRGLIRIISFITAAFAALSVVAVYGYAKAQEYRTTLEYSYERTFNDLATHLNNIDITLNKAIYTASENEMNVLVNNLTKESSSAKTCISQLPIMANELEKINKFLSQVGEYSFDLAHKMGQDQDITNKEYENLYSLHQYASDISDSLNSMINNSVDGERIFISDTKRSIFGDTGTDSYKTVSDGLQKTEEQFSDFPTLIYDGPFSDNILTKEPLLTKNEKTVTKNEALKIASAFLKEDITNITVEEDQLSNMECFCFSAEDKYIAITKRGGRIAYSHNPRSVGAIEISPEECIVTAENFLAEKGYSNLRDTYYSIYNGVCTINFAYSFDGILYYTDLIKVGIAMDNTEVLNLDATGYIMNHHERNIDDPIISEESARDLLSPALEVISAQQCVIPSSGENEIFCYEFRCKGYDDDELLVYINANTGEEEQIFILLISDNGVLTI